MTPNTENTAGSDCQQRFVRISSYSAKARKDERGQFYIHPLTGDRVNEPAEGWPKHSFSFTPIKIRLAEKHKLGLSNRDGDILIGKGDDGRCYLIAEADTYHCPEVIDGMGSAQFIEIAEAAFLSLANVKEHTPLPAGASDETGVQP